jgi:hypothetical protein
MPPEPIVADHPAGRFTTTRWSTVAIASDASSPVARAALERLCQDYWPPLFGQAAKGLGSYLFIIHLAIWRVGRSIACSANAL